MMHLLAALGFVAMVIGVLAFFAVLLSGRISQEERERDRSYTDPGWRE